jgi:hypothetical protein
VWWVNNLRHQPAWSLRPTASDPHPFTIAIDALVRRADVVQQARLIQLAIVRIGTTLCVQHTAKL